MPPDFISAWFRSHIGKATACLLRLAVAGAFLGLIAYAHATTYVPTIFTDPPVSGGVNSANGVITGGAGNGQVSLRSAIIAANAHAGADIINLTGGGTYTLSITGNDADCMMGDLDINDSLTINGAGAATTIIQGASAFNSGTGVYTNSIGDKVIGINQDGTHTGLAVSISNVTIRWGQNTIPFGDPTFAYTGAGVDVFFTGTTGNTATFTNCVFTENFNVNSYGGGVNVDSGASFVGGDTVTNVFRGTATFTGCVFSNNRTGLWGAGLNLFSDKHDVNITNCNFSGNNALATGGGGAQGGGINIRHTNGGTVAIDGSTISGNTGRGAGGGICAAGAGSQVLNITNSVISGNIALNNGATSPRGGGMSHANAQTTTLNNVLITGNTISGGTGTPEGGGLVNEGGTLLVKNTTISGNSSTGDGGGFFWVGSPVTTMTNVTISNNRADSDNNATGTGGGIRREASATTTLTLQNTIVDGNFKGSGVVVDEISGAVTANFSLIGNTTGTTITGANNQANVSARLVALANNGGPTVGPAGFTAVLRTHALNAGSAALDTGSNALATGASLTTDQRGTGFARSLDAADANTTAEVDIGAFEAHPSVQDIADQAIPEDASLGFSFNVGDAASGFISIVAASSNPALVPNNVANLDATGSGSSRSLTINPVANAFGSTTITVTATATVAGTAQTMSDTFVLTVNPVADTPSVTNAATNEDTQSAAGLVISRNVADGAEVTHFKITGITNGTLFKTDGTTVIANNSFITFTEGNAGLKFTPAPNFFGNGSFGVQASLSNVDAGLGGSVVTATITVNPVADTPSVTNSTTLVNQQTTTGLVISRNAADGAEVTHFKITAITNGTLFQNNGTTVINNNDFITFAVANAGLKFTPANNFTGTGNFSVQASVSNVNGGLGGAVVTASITVNQPPAITNGPPPSPAQLNQNYPNYFTYTSTGFPAPTFSATGLPTGFSISVGGVISGTPTVGGTFTGTVTASNGVAPNATQNFTIQVVAPPAITNGPPPATGVRGTAYNFTYNFTGFPTPTFSVTAGALPPGLVLSPAGVISGTPGTTGLFTGTVTATNGTAPDATQNFSITINQAPAFTNGAPPSPVFMNAPYNFAFTATGSPAPTFSVPASGTAGGFPTGITMNSAGVVSGTPTGTGTTAGITVTATNAAGAVNQIFSITVNAFTPPPSAPAITSANTATFTVGVAGSTFQMTATGSPAPTWSTGALPSGVTLSSGGLLSGTPGAGTQGNYPITVTAANGTAPNATQAFTLIVVTPSSITATKDDSFAAATLKSPGDTIPYTMQITNTGGSNATNVVLTDPTPANTTMVAGSVHASPIAFNDAYTAVGNTKLYVGTTPPAGEPAVVSAVPNLLANDTISTAPDTIVLTSGTFATTQGGSVTINADGTFTYTPLVNFTGTDTFTYAIKNSADASLTDTGTVTITVSNLVWYVDNTGANGNGTSASPFNTLAGAAGASAANAFIYVKKGTATYTGGITLKSGQTFQSESTALVVNTITLRAAVPANVPTLSHTTASTVALSTGDTITGFIITNSAGNGISGAAIGTTVISNVDINVFNGAALSVTTSGTLTVTGTNTLTATGGTALNVANVNIGVGGLTFRSISVTGASNVANGIVLNTTGTAGKLTVTGSGFAGTGGTIQIVNGDGISLTSTKVDLSWMLIKNNNNSGIKGTSVSGFKLTDSVIQNNTNASGEQAGILLNDLTDPAALVTRAAVSGSKEDNVRVHNTNTTGTIVFDNCTVTDNDTNVAGAGNNGVFFQTNLTGNLTGTVKNSALHGNRAIALSADSGDGSTLSATFTGNTITSGLPSSNQGNQGIQVSRSLTSTLTFNITGNTVNGMISTLINVFSGSGPNGVSAPGAGAGSGVVKTNICTGTGVGGNQVGIRVFNSGTSVVGFGAIFVNVSGNTVTNIDNAYPILGESSGSSGVGGLLQIAVTGNTANVAAPGAVSSIDCIRIQARNNSTVTARVNTNTTNSGGSGFFGIQLRRANTTSFFNLEGLTLGSQTDPTVHNYVAAQNPAGGTVGTLAAVGQSDVTGVANGAGTGIPPLLFAPAEIESFGMGTPDSVASAVALSETMRFRTEQARISAKAAAIVPLTQTQLDAAVTAARARWEASGLSAAQRTALDGLKFEIADLPGWYLGEAAGNTIRVDMDAGGNGWIVGTGAESRGCDALVAVRSSDAAVAGGSGGAVLAPAKNDARGEGAAATDGDEGVAATGSDALFGQRHSATRLSTLNPQLSSRIDLLTAVLHEMGHSLGLADSYLQTDRDSVMYGFLTRGERRLPAPGQARGATPAFEAAPHFLSAPLAIGTLPPGKTVTVKYSVTINAGTTTNIVSQGTVAADGPISVLTDDVPASGASADPTITLVAVAPAFTNGPAPSPATVFTPYAFGFTASGNPAPTFSLQSGTLPTGLTLTSAGALIGTPGATGTFIGTVKASNGVGTDATQGFTIVVNQAPAFTNGPAPSNGTAGVAYNFTSTASGSPAPTFTAPGLPTGLAMSTGGAITGTPTAAGVFNGTITASNGIGSDATQNFSITIRPSVTPSSASIGVTATTMTINGAGFDSVTPGNNVVAFSGGVTGTVTAATSTQLTVTSLAGLSVGTLNASVTTNGVSSGSPVQVATVAALSVSPSVLPAAISGTAYSQTLTVTGGALPLSTLTMTALSPGTTGLTAGNFSANLAAGTLALSFTPTAGFTAPTTATFTVNATDAASASVSQNYTLTVNPVPNAVATPASQTKTSGTAITTIALTGNVAGTVFNWTRDNTVGATGIAASGAGDISGTLTNATSAPITVTFTVTPSFTNAGATVNGTPITATVIVNPIPNAVATPASQTKTSGTAITTIALTGNVTGTVFNWTRDNTVGATGIAASGVGNISGTLTNATSAPITVTFTVTPSGNGVTGATTTATVTVNPIPNAVATPASQTKTSGTAITTIALTGNVTGTVFNWTRDNTVGATGIAASGAGDISGTLTNATSAPITVTFTVTPVANGVTGPTTTATVTVNPIPNAVATPASQTVFSGVAITPIVLSGNVTGTTFNWTRDNLGTTGIAASGSGNISGTLTNTTNAPVTVTFTVTPSANSVTGPTTTATVTVNPVDYDVTTAGNAITVTDLSGNSDTLNVTEPVAGSIKFAAASRSFRLNGGAITVGDSGNLSLTNVTAITVNAGAGNDVINVGAFTVPMPSLTINGGTGNDTVNMNGSITFAANASLDLDLQNDDPTPGTDAVNIAPNANILTSGTGTITVKVSKNFLMNTGSSLETVNGGITLEANQQAVATAGTFFGISVSAGIVRSTGTGLVSVIGKGGTSGASQNGVVVQTGSLISGGTTGTTAVTGFGGSSTGNGNIGVAVLAANSLVTSAGANVVVTGAGGSSGASTANNFGVSVAFAGTIKAGGAGTVTVSGTGAAGSAAQGYGVNVNGAGSTITSTAGDVFVTGNGGGFGAGGNVFHIGVVVTSAGLIAAGGPGHVTVAGTSAATADGGNYGIDLESGGKVTSAGGNVTVTGTSQGTGASAFPIGVVMLQNSEISSAGAGTVTINATGSNASNASSEPDGLVLMLVSGTVGPRIASAGGTIVLNCTRGTPGTTAVGFSADARSVITGGPVTIVSDQVVLDTSANPAVINAGTGNVAIRPKSIGEPINLGAADTVNLLGLTDAELNRITAGTVTIGDANSGAITVSAVISPANYKTLAFGQNTTFSATGGFASEIGPTATDIEKISVAGTVTINAAATLSIAAKGGFVPATGQNFQIVTNDLAEAIVGNFAGFPDGGTIPNFLGSGIPAQISYSAGTGNDLVIITNQPPVAGPVSAVRNPSASLKIPVAQILAQTSDPDPADTVTIVSVSVPAHGTATLSTSDGLTGTVFYTPAPGWLLGDTFSYTVTDNHGAQTTGTVTIFVNGSVTGAAGANITAMSRAGNGSVSLRFAGIPGFTYGLQFTDDLLNPWQNLGPITMDAVGSATYLDNAHNASPNVFYRFIYPAP